MIRLGLTGGIACGKSLASQWFEDRQIPVIDSDAVNRSLLDHDPNIQQAIGERFGAEVFARPGKIDRLQLRQIIFSDPDARHDLESILHPAIRQGIETWSLQQESPPRSSTAAPAYCVIVVPLLFESGFDTLVDQSCVIDCPEAIQLQRLTTRDGTSPEQARAILATQMPREQRLQRANHVLNNPGSKEHLYRQLEQLHQHLMYAGLPADSR